MHHPPSLPHHPTHRLQPQRAAGAICHFLSNQGPVAAAHLEAVQKLHAQITTTNSTISDQGMLNIIISGLGALPSPAPPAPTVTQRRLAPPPAGILAPRGVLRLQRACVDTLQCEGAVDALLGSDAFLAGPEATGAGSASLYNLNVSIGAMQRATAACAKAHKQLGELQYQHLCAYEAERAAAAALLEEIHAAAAAVAAACLARSELQIGVPAPQLSSAGEIVAGMSSLAGPTNGFYQDLMDFDDAPPAAGALVPAAGRGPRSGADGVRHSARRRQQQQARIHWRRCAAAAAGCC